MTLKAIDIETIDVDRLVPLFADNVPNRALLYSVLEGQNRASVIVDDLSNPSSCLLRTNFCAFTFCATQDAGFLADAIQVVSV
ncbi:MAG: hypothetical protein HN712_24720 [Gemmatimonadetes bacterium]|jgi:hypothetical protein|nr:hypothetical protein [Gemmatimonadota bacterium]MBT6147072.1 hypothetical protein [Gemmatimonadota bacterium]MBT7863543.1 hypothetical protein [Gemmatimonadota bacterium]